MGVRNTHAYDDKYSTINAIAGSCTEKEDIHKANKTVSNIVKKQNVY